MRLFWWRYAALAVLGLGLIASARMPGSRPVEEAIRLNNLGVAYMNQQRFAQALEQFEQAYEVDPELHTARLNQGIALLNLQRYDAARAALLAAGEQEPGNVRVWYNLGLLHKNLGETEVALEVFQRVAQLDARDADTQYFLGLLRSQLQRYEPAIAAFQAALALNPFHVSAEFGLARAYQRRGDSARARQHLARFQHLTQENLGAPMSLIYGEQGQHSRAEQVARALGAVAAAIRVRFVPAAEEAGLRFRHGGAPSSEGKAAASHPTEETAASFLGSGACFLDYDGDGRTDLFLVNSGKEAAGALYRNGGGGRFVEVTRKARLDAVGTGMGCTAADYDNDGWTDLAVSFLGRVALFRNQGDGTFADVAPEVGIRTDGLPLGLTFLDYDHDGDLDLYVTRFVNFAWRGGRQPFELPVDVISAGNVLWRNNGNGTFTDWTKPTGLAGAAPSVAAVSTDFNNDRAIDLLLTGLGNAPTIFANPREGEFPALELWATPMPAPTAGVAVFDFDKDGWMDLAFTHWGEPGLSLWRNVEGRRFDVVALPSVGWVRGWGVAALDYDNDGWLDLAAVGETGEKSEIRLLRNLGPKGFEDVTSAVALAEVELQRPRALITADYDGDGDTDLLVTQNGGPVRLLRNQGGNRNAWLRVALKGLADNKSAIGTKVEIFAGALWQKWEVQAASGYLGQSAVEVTAGLGTASAADILRLRWPTGVLQDELELAARRSHAVDEIDRRGSSCPVLFVWNGSRYELVSDIIGPAVVGHWVAPGERNISDPDEYVKVEGARVQPRQGRLSFRLLEPMEELIYLDQVRLLAVDHPADVAVYPNEYFASQPPFPVFKVIASRGAHAPLGAWDERGRDVREELLRRDRRYVTGFELLSFTGFAELHSLELDLGEWDASRPLRLLLHGFTEYFSANSMYAAHQAGVVAIVPYVEALDGEGHWVRVVDDMGFPAGLARTMVADLTGRLPAGTRRIRLVTNLQIYWDQILVDNTADDAPVRLTEVPLAEATLRFLGYPRQVEGNPPGDLDYVYEEVSPTGPFAQHIGNYTRTGDVRALLAEAEDRFAIFGTGEEVALEFDPSSLPPLPAGWARDYFFFADGFVKDMDFYEAHALTVDPLPFHDMGRYPYPPTKSYPPGEAHLKYQLDYNTRPVSGRAGSLFRFNYRRTDKR